MKGSCPLSSIVIAAAVISSCYSYAPVGMTRRLSPGGTGSPSLRVETKKCFARIPSPGPLARINNRAVRYAAEGKLQEAWILFGEVIREGEDLGAGYNNLAVVQEILGKRKEAFDLYTRACLLEPDNGCFRENFLSFADYRDGGGR